jgi:uncharacterized protein YdaU (DUF1376 family)
MNYYRRYVGDYLADTASLSLAEHGAYNLLLDYAYATEKPIPADRDEILRLVRAFSDVERKAVAKILDRYWVLEPDGYHNPRVDKELGKAVVLIEKQKANGSLGGRPKKTQDETQTITQPETQTETQAESQLETQTITQNNQPPTTNHHTPTTTPQPPASSLQPPAGRSRASARKRAPPTKTPLSDDFTVSERVKAWAKGKGFDRLPDHFESFVSKVKAKGYTYADWDEALMGAIRDDWARLRQAHDNGTAFAEAERLILGQSERDITP